MITTWEDGPRACRLPLDAAPRLVVQFAVAEEIVDPFALRGNEQAFDFVVQLTVFFAGAVAGTSIFDMLQAILVLSACHVDDIGREIAFGGKLVE